jgi:hypothetical protein
MKRDLTTMNPKLLLAFLTAPIVHFACGTSAQPKCPAGQFSEAGACVENLSCGPGTRAEGTACVALTAPECPPGSSLANGQCVAIEPEVSCGPGTVLVNNTCRLAKDAGPPSDATVDATPAPFFEVRLGVGNGASTTVLANGYSEVPVLVTARAADGTPLTDRFVLKLERPSSGTIQDTTVVVGQLGVANTAYVACKADAPLCAGKTRITMANAFYPDVIVAKSREFELVVPKPVGSPAPCALEPNFLYLDGEATDPTHQGIEGFVTASSVMTTLRPDGIGNASFTATPGGGRYWYLHLGMGQIDAPLQTGVYNAPEFLQAQNPPEFSIYTGSRVCAAFRVDFQIHKLNLSASKELQEMLVTFERRCFMPVATLRGCMHYTR